MDEKIDHDGRDPFWEFSLRTYEAPGAAPACLALQDRLGVDVNLLLFLCWISHHGRVLDGKELAVIVDHAREWQEKVVTPLRQVRRALKHQSFVETEAGEALRDQVKALELEAERLEQITLQRAMGDDLAAECEAKPLNAAAVAAGNLRLYLDSLSAAPRLEDIADLAALLRASFPGVAPLEAVWLMSDEDGG